MNVLAQTVHDWMGYNKYSIYQASLISGLNPSDFEEISKSQALTKNQVEALMPFLEDFLTFNEKEKIFTQIHKLSKHREAKLHLSNIYKLMNYHCYGKDSNSTDSAVNLDNLEGMYLSHFIALIKSFVEELECQKKHIMIRNIFEIFELYLEKMRDPI